MARACQYIISIPMVQDVCGRQAQSPTAIYNLLWFGAIHDDAHELVPIHRCTWLEYNHGSATLPHINDSRAFCVYFLFTNSHLLLVDNLSSVFKPNSSSAYSA